MSRHHPLLLLLLSFSLSACATPMTTPPQPAAAVQATAEQEAQAWDFLYQVLAGETGFVPALGVQTLMRWPDIPGSSTMEGYGSWIVIDSLSFGAKRAISSPGAGREASPAAVREIVLNKAVDVATPKLMREALVGTPKAQVEIALVGRDAKGLAPVVSFKLDQVLLSEFDFQAGEAGMRELLALNFGKFTMTVYPRNASGQALPPITVSYDLAMAN